MTTLTIKNANIITLDPEHGTIRNGAILIENDKIRDIGKNNSILDEYGEKGKVIDANGKTAIPGMINAHTHMFQALIRDLGDDRSLSVWVNEVLNPISDVINDEDLRVAADLSCLEMIKTGSTGVISHEYNCTSEKSIKKLAEIIERSGMRGLIARGMKSKELYEEEEYETPYELPYLPYTTDEEIKITKNLLDDLNRKEGKVKVCPAPASLHVVTPELLQRVKDLSSEYDTKIHTHVAETKSEVKKMEDKFGMRQAEYLYENDLLNSNFHLVHGVWLEDYELDMIAEKKANVIYNPTSNAYLASGIPPIEKMLERNINIALATDGPASNNSQNMVETLKIGALLPKANTRDPESVGAYDVLCMATIGGARALGMADRLGTIEPGKKADIVLLESKNPHTSPVHRSLSSIVYSAMGSDVKTVVIDGELIMENGKVLTLDEDKVIERAEDASKDLISRADENKLLKE